MILGGDEIAKGVANLKDLVSGEQKTLNRQSLAQELKKELHL